MRRSLAIFDSRCSLRTWVYRVAHNAAVKHSMRIERRTFVALKGLDEIDELPECQQRRIDVASVDTRALGLSGAMVGEASRALALFD